MTYSVTLTCFCASLSIGWGGCSRKTNEQPKSLAAPSSISETQVITEPSQIPGPAAVPAGATAGSEETLNTLTQALRRYAVERRGMPASFSEVIAAGYVKAYPPAPAGQKYEIDRNTSRVVLVKQ